MFSNSKKLCVLVTEGDRQVVSVRLPAAAVGWMETLMPKHVLAKIEEKNIDLAAIKQRAKDSDLAPQELFSMVSGARTYRVSLE